MTNYTLRANSNVGEYSPRKRRMEYSLKFTEPETSNCFIWSLSIISISKYQGLQNIEYKNGKKICEKA